MSTTKKAANRVGSGPLVRPDALRLLMDWQFVGRAYGRSFRCTLKAGEIGKYFAHSHCFTFKGRRGWVPYIWATDIMANPEAWEPWPNAEMTDANRTEKNQ